MRYFEGKAVLTEEIKPRTAEGSAVCTKITNRSEDYLHDYNGKYCGCVIEIKDRECRFIFAGNGDTDVLMEEAKNFWEFIDVDGELVKVQEIVSEKVLREVRRSRCIDLPDDIEEFFGINNLRRLDYEEKIISPSDTVSLDDYAEKNHIPELKKEAGRIKECQIHKFSGHPVHYIIESNSSEKAMNTAENLIGSLIAVNRLQSGRIIRITNNMIHRGTDYAVSEIYNNICGGTVIISVNANIEENEYADSSDELIEISCKYACKYRDKVLTIFHIPRNDKKSENKIAAYLNNEITTITFCEVAAGYFESSEYLKALAAEKNINDTDELLKRLDSENNSYFISDLDNIFKDYYSEYLRTRLYPAYAKCKSAEIKEVKPKGNAAAELEEMIGLDDVKNIINKSVSYYKLQKLYSERNMKLTAPARSMVFTGNPGTAKTTVARLTAKIFKDNNILENGNLVEVGRADLIGKYVGWTAPLVKQAFRKAKGSILFIDEAYSLVDGKSGYYGDEAINTIVQEMENHRDDTIVIFAGYPDKMQEFINRNPGLRSRIAFHVNFPDYSENELLDIMKLMTKNQSMYLSENAEEKLLSIFGDAVKLDDFGNGRFVRNLLEQGIMSMAHRLSGIETNKITDIQLTTLLAEDFSMPQLCSEKEVKQRIGF